MKAIIQRSAVLLVLLTLIPAAGCENAGQGALSGAGIGALSGLAIGSLSGNAGAGAAIGAVAGGVGGAVIGDQNRRRKEEAAAAQQAPPPQTVVVQQQPYYTGSALYKFVGHWQITGTVDAGNGTKQPVYGTADAVIDKVYFVRIDAQFNNPRTKQNVSGTIVLSQTGGRGVESTNVFSSTPEIRCYRGTMDTSGTVFNLTQFDPPGESRTVNIQFQNNGSWTADVWSNGKLIESYTFFPA